MIQMKIPFLAEGVESGTVVSILVSEGSQVKKDQTVLELETNKATAPIPAPSAGTVTKIHVKEGDEVQVGQVVIVLSESGVGSGEKSNQEESRQPKKGFRSVGKPQVPETVSEARAGESDDYTYQSKSGLPPPASPSVRKVARDLGIDLAKVRGRERGGRVTLEDLKAYIQNLREAPAQAKIEKAPLASVHIDFSKWGPVTRKPVSSVRRIIGQKMHESWTAIPHVTQFADADITLLLELRKKYVVEYEKQGAHLTITAMILKAVIRVLKKYPVFNSSLDEAKNEIVYKNYYHLGVAVDTEQGLLVPVVRNVDQKGLLELSIELAQLAEKTRQRKISLEELQGGSFTISNLGSIGGAHFTPIINRPEVAILGLGQGVQKPAVKDGKIVASTILPVCLSYDHRVIDGADGARFVQELVRLIENFEESDLMIQKGAKKVNPKV